MGKNGLGGGGSWVLKGLGLAGVVILRDEEKFNFRFHLGLDFYKLFAKRG